jgi:Ca2+-binding RTX toxin-like protein
MATIKGTSANNNLLGTSANDLIYGYDGNDTLDGGSGADTLYGGKGDDTYIVDNIGDKIIEVPGEGTDTIRALVNYTIGDYVNNLTLIGTASINGTGNEYDNVIISNSGNNILNGGAGNDKLTGGTGNDSLFGGIGIDQIVEVGDFNYVLTDTSLVRTIVLSSLYTLNTSQTFTSNTPLAIADYSIITSTLNVSGLSGNITDVNVLVNISHTWNSDLRVFLLNPLGTQVELFSEVGIAGQGFLNTLLDDESSTSITSGSGTFTGTFRPQGNLATFDGTAPNGSWKLKIIDDAEGDTGTLNSWAVNVNETTLPPPPQVFEVDTLNGIEQANLTGGNGNNKLDATTFSLGNVTLRGEAGNDTLIGGNKNDTLIGGMGNDLLTGGQGNDYFTFNSKNEGIDQITDFLSHSDKIVISASGFGGGLTFGVAITASQWVIGAAATTSSHRLIYNSINKNLFFDVDGNGTSSQIQLANLANVNVISSNDILVIA